MAGRHTRSWGECGACARACNPLSGGFGHQRSGITTGVGGATLDWDRLGAGNARAETDGLRRKAVKGIVRPPRPRKPGLQLSWEVTTAQREPPWNAERRAVPAGTAPRPLARVFATRLSAFRVLILFFRSPG